MRIIRNKFHALLAIPLTTLLYGGGDIVPVEPFYAAPVKNVELQQDKMFYAYIMAGNAFHSIKSDKNIAFSNAGSDDSATVIDVGIGYSITSEMFMELAYQRKIFDQNDIDSIYLSANYIYLPNQYNPYIGALVGYSQLTWNADPTEVANSFDKKATSYLIGLQTGLEVPLTDTLSLSAKYQFMLHDYILDVRNVSPAMENENSHNIIGGIKYDF